MPNNRITEADIAPYVAQCFALANKDTQEDALLYTITELSREINTSLYCYNLTANEVGQALRCGTLGEYGEYYSLSVVAFVRFIREYVKTRPLQKALPVPSKTDSATQKESRIKVIESGIINYQRTGELSDLGSWKYDYFDRSGLLKYSNKDKFDALEITKDEVTRSRHTSVFPIFSEILMKKFTKNERIAAAKLYLLKKFYDSIIAANKIPEFITQLKKI